MRTKTVMTIAVSICAAIVVAYAADKKNEDSCKPYLGKGYCTDYVNSGFKTRVPGDANKWKSNVPTSDVRKGDAAIFRSANHVARVEKVNVGRNGKPESVNISEMNAGNYKDKRANGESPNKECFVTSKFGEKTTRNNIPISKVDGGFRRDETVSTKASNSASSQRGSQQSTSSSNQKKSWWKKW